METSSGYQTTVDTDSFHPPDVLKDGADPPAPGQVLALPAPAAERGAGGPQVGLGETVQMDHLGPMVVGEDGSISRIANWAKLTEREREVALRRITARNRERLQRLRGETAVQQGLTAAAETAAAGASAATDAGQQQALAPTPETTAG